MYVFWQYDLGIDVEGMLVFGLGDYVVQQVDFVGQQVGVVVMQGDGEEIGVVGDLGLLVVWYWGLFVYLEGFWSVFWLVGG